MGSVKDPDTYHKVRQDHPYVKVLTVLEEQIAHCQAEIGKTTDTYDARYWYDALATLTAEAARFYRIIARTAR